jgi:hypothetical protein
MSINYNLKLGTYVCQDTCGCVLSVYDPATHGTVDEFRNAMGRIHE